MSTALRSLEREDTPDPMISQSRDKWDEEVSVSSLTDQITDQRRDEQREDGKSVSN